MKRTFTISGLLLLFTFFATTAIAQNITVKGKVTDAKGEALIGVSVGVKGTTIGAQTDVNGVYTVSAPSNATLVISYIGFTSQQIVVNGRATIDVKLQASSTELQQVVVVGYGTQRKRDVTGAVATVTGGELAKQPVQTPTQALQGKVAGVQVISSGAPNSQPTVRIRGTGTLLAGADPLYVVDGVLTNDIRNINNNDIVSLDILKDASAAAIYGVRAANGVIIITTKQGQKGVTKVSYDGTVGYHDASKVVKMANSEQYVSYLGDAAPSTVIPQYNGTTDWFGQILRKSFMQSNNVSISGGSDKTTFFFSAGYLTDNGIVINNNFNRINLRTNEVFTLSDKFKVSTQIAFSNSNTRNVNIGGAYNDAYRAAPIIPAQVNGLYGNTALFGNVGNPLLDIGKNNDQLTENRLQGNIALEYKPIKNLTLRSAINTDVNFNSQRVYNYKYAADGSTYITPGGNQRGDFSQLIFTRNNNNRYIFDNTATYQQSFGNHSLTVLGGFTTERYYQQYTYGAQKGVPANQDLWYLGAGDPTTDQVSNYDPANPLFGDKFTRQSFLGRINYSYAGKYLFTANIRDDGSSKFAADNRYAVFPSFGAGWVLSEEGFMKGQKLFDLLKIRAGYGKIGNDNISSNQFIVTANSNIPYFFGGIGSTGLPTTTALGASITDLKNPNLKWETTEEYDAAIEFGLLNSRLTGEVSYYTKKTKNALINVQIPAIFGDPNNQYITNAATISNKGIEAGLNWRDNVNTKLKYNIGVNATFNTNRILSLNGGQALPDGGVGQQGFTTLSDNGVAAGSFYLLKAIGVFQNQAEVDAAPATTYEGNRIGGLKYADVSGPAGSPDGRIDAYDRVYAGSYQPKVYFGISGGITYSALDLSFGFSGSLGNKIYNGKKAFRYQSTDNIEAAYANDRYTTANPSLTDPQTIQSNTPASSYFIESGSYLRLNNLTLGYTLPAGSLGRMIKSLRIYGSSQNLFTITKYSGFTPELPGSSPTNAGIETNAYPTPRTVVFGVNLGL